MCVCTSVCVCVLGMRGWAKAGWLVKIYLILGSLQCPGKAWHVPPTGLSFIRKGHVI